MFSSLEFRRERVDSSPPAGKASSCLVADLTGNGLPDVVVGARGGDYDVEVAGRRISLAHLPVFRQMTDRLQTHLYWYENTGSEWIRHDVARSPRLDVSGTLADLTGNSRLDFVSGQGNGNRDLYWFEQPSDPRDRWTRHLVGSPFEKYHDVAVADVDDDGRPELVGLSQGSDVAFYYDVPADPHETPWPERSLHIVDTDVHVEGLAVLDVDGDGRTEVVAGPYLYRRSDEGWIRERITGDDWEYTRVVAADLTGDGDTAIVLAEGDMPYAGDRPGRLGVFERDEDGWSANVLHDSLSNPHSLQVADFDGNGLLDIYVGEMDLEPGHDPRQFVFRNETGYEPEVIDRGVGTHEAKAVDLTGDGRPDIVGKAYDGSGHTDVWYNET